MKKKTAKKAPATKPKPKPKPKRRRRTKAEMTAARAAEQKKAAKVVDIKAVQKSSNAAKAVTMVSTAIVEGQNKSDILFTVRECFKISDTDSIYKAALEYLQNDHFKDNISFYANHITELEYLYVMAVGRGVQRPDDTKEWVVDYKEARSILKQIEDATLSVNQILQFY